MSNEADERMAERALDVAAATPKELQTETLVYLDKGALSELWRSGEFSEQELTRVRRRLCSKWFKRRPKVLIGPVVISELAPLEGHRQFEAEIGLLRQLPDPRLLKPRPELIRAEVARFYGQTEEPWLDGAMAEAVLGPVAALPEMWAAERQQLITSKEAYRHRQDRLQADMALRTPDRAAQVKAAKEFFAEPEKVVSDWVKFVLRDNVKDLGLPANEDEWPPANRLPTVWAFAGYAVARLYLQMHDGRKVDPNDHPDSLHYMSAIYADELVLTDRKFERTIELCPSPKPRVRRFKDWCEDLLGKE